MRSKRTPSLLSLGCKRVLRNCFPNSVTGSSHSIPRPWGSHFALTQPSYTPSSKSQSPSQVALSNWTSSTACMSNFLCLAAILLTLIANKRQQTCFSRGNPASAGRAASCNLLQDRSNPQDSLSLVVSNGTYSYLYLIACREWEMIV